MSQEAMNPQTARKLLEVGEAFRIPGPFFSYEEIKMGNVNHTYKVNYIRDDGTGMAKVKSYLVQRVNTYAFQRPVELMKNIDGVTGHIRQKHPGAQYLHFHHTQDGCNYLFDEDGFWRLSNYVPSVTYDSCDDLGVVRSAGEAFGSFQMMLSDFDASSLYYTIPDFHNTRKRYAKLREDMESDPCGPRRGGQGGAGLAALRGGASLRADGSLRAGRAAAARDPQRHEDQQRAL